MLEMEPNLNILQLFFWVYISCGPHTFIEDFNKKFLPIISTTNDPFGMANFDPRDMVGTVGDH